MEPTGQPSPAPGGKWDMYAAMLAGPKQLYYLEAFKRIDGSKGTWRAWFSLNWGALLFTFHWLRHRKLYAWSWGYFFVSLPVIVLVQFIAASSDRCAAALEGGLFGLYWLPPAMLCANVLLPLLANRLYFDNVSKRVAAASGGTLDAAQLQRLTAATATGGYRGSIAGMSALVIVVLGLPGAYGGGYMTRAKLSEVILAGAIYRTSASEYFAQHKRLPASINDIGGFAGPAGRVRAVTLEKDGTIKVVANFSPAAGRSILFVPGVREGKLHWVCRSHDLPAQCLPANCRP